jgi:predicted MFS family arabinose efflux permease
MMVDTGWSLTAIGVVTTIVAGAFTMAGAVGSGLLVRRWGRRRALFALSGVQALAVLALLPLAAGSREAALTVVVVCLVNVGFAAASTVIYTVNMDLCREASPGTDYTVLASFAFACSMIAGALALTLAGQFGYVAVIIGAAAVIGLGLLVAARVFVDRAAPVPAPVTA